MPMTGPYLAETVLVKLLLVATPGRQSAEVRRARMNMTNLLQVTRHLPIQFCECGTQWCTLSSRARLLMATSACHEYNVGQYRKVLMTQGKKLTSMWHIQLWTFTFTGSGQSKYSNEMLKLTCNFEFEYSEELQTAILNNWLCNLSGQTGCWFPMDLLQEKNIKQLKKCLNVETPRSRGISSRRSLQWTFGPFCNLQNQWGVCFSSLITRKATQTNLMMPLQRSC